MPWAAFTRILTPISERPHSPTSELRSDGKSLAERYCEIIENAGIESRYSVRLDIPLYNETLTGEPLRDAKQRGIVIRDRTVAFFQKLVDGYANGSLTVEDIDERLRAKNRAGGIFSSISGGDSNWAGGMCSSVSGGSRNSASNYFSSVSGGGYNRALGTWSSVSGGYANTALGHYSSVSGGSNRGVSGNESWRGGKYYSIN